MDEGETTRKDHSKGKDSIVRRVSCRWLVTTFLFFLQLTKNLNLYELLLRMHYLALF